ncbi:MAG: NAD-dependent epimerase/dehydratase family protein [Acidaminobacteraceae bacterium]
MKKILVTGAFGQIGSELTDKLRGIYGNENVIATGTHIKKIEFEHDGPADLLDVTNYEMVKEIIEKYKPDTIMHLAAILSAKGEMKPALLWDVNMNGLYNMLEISREKGLSLFVPSSIAAFGPNTPSTMTPQDTIQRPTTIYGVSKVAGELLCDYYHDRFAVDTRGVRFPGLVSYKALPGGGTTDYAVHIYYAAIKDKKFVCDIDKDTKMDMMYMPDALNAIIELMETDGGKLIHRNAFNIASMSFTPAELSESIKKEIPDFEITYEVNEMKQKIANSWPDSLDDSAARVEWGHNPKFDIDRMTKSMIEEIQKKLNM